MARPFRLFALAVLAVAAAPAVAGAGIVERRPITDEGRIAYRDELDFDDGFRLVEAQGPDGRELHFERTTGTQPLRSTDVDCAAESADFVRCRLLEGRDVVLANMIAGRDQLDASRVRTFRIQAFTGSGDARLTGGPLADELSADEGQDVVSGGAGDDRLSAGSTDAFANDDDLVDGGPGRDRILAGDDRDRVLARDGERDSVDCGSGSGDVVVADREDELRRCEVVEYPPPREQAPPPSSPPAGSQPPGDPRPPNESEPRPEPQPGPSSSPEPGPGPGPAPASADAPSRPASAPAAERDRAADLRRVVSLSRRCAGRRGVKLRVRPAGGFVPARTRVTVGRRVSARRTGRRVTVRLRRPVRRTATIRVLVVGRDGRRLQVRRTLRRC